MASITYPDALVLLPTHVEAFDTATLLTYVCLREGLDVADIRRFQVHRIRLAIQLTWHLAT